MFGAIRHAAASKDDLDRVWIGLLNTLYISAFLWSTILGGAYLFAT